MLLLGLRFKTQLKLALMKNVSTEEIIPSSFFKVQFVDYKHNKLL